MLVYRFVFTTKKRKCDTFRNKNSVDCQISIYLAKNSGKGNCQNSLVYRDLQGMSGLQYQ